MPLDGIASENDVRAFDTHSFAVKTVLFNYAFWRNRRKAYLFRTRKITLVRLRKLLTAEAEIPERFGTVDFHSFSSAFSLSSMGRTFSEMRRAT